MSEHDLQEVWRRRSARAASNRAGCLTEDEFARLLSGEASQDERARVAQHLATCSSCAEEFKLLEPVRDWAGDAARVLAPAAAAPQISVAASTRWGLAARTGWLLAAACVLIAIGGGLFMLQMREREQATRLEGQIAQQQHALSNAQSTIASLQAQLEAQRRQPSTAPGGAPSLSAPLLDVPIVDVEPVGTGGSRGAGGTQAVTLPREAKAVVLILNFPPLDARTTLGIEIADEQGQVRWSGTTERPRQTASLNLTLPREAFPTGTYRIRLAKAGTRQDEIAVYRIALR